MRNKFASNCYVCGKTVEVGQGFFQRHKGRWLTKHKECKPVYVDNQLQITPPKQ